MATTWSRSPSSRVGSPRRPRKRARTCSPRPRRRSCSSRTESVLRDPLGRQGARQGGRGALQLRARLGRNRARDGARGGDVGPPHGRRDPRVLARREPRPAGLVARRQGGVEGRQAARSRDPHARVAASLRREVPASSEGRGSIRWAQTVSRSGSSSASTTPTPLSQATTCFSSSSRASSSRASSRAASASHGARRRSPRAATGRCRSSPRRAW